MGEFKSRLLDVIFEILKKCFGPVRSKRALIPLLRIMLLCFVQVKGCTIKNNNDEY